MSQQSVMLRIFLIAAALLSCGWTLPGSYKRYKQPVDSGGALSHVIAEVNGERQVIESGKILTLLRGDSLKIIEAFLNDRSQKPSRVNLIGFSNPKAPIGEDRGQQIDTAKKFDAKWGVGPKKQFFAVAVSSKKTLHGSVYLKFDMPKLKFADILVNKKLRVMREGEVLVLEALDKIKIQEIRTNISDSTQVKFQIVKVNDEELKKSHLREAESYEIQFHRENLLFAKIPMLVEGL